MEENVALDSSKQKEFIKSIKGIKKILKVKDTAKITKGKVNIVQAGKIKKPKRKQRGLVYLSHIPHGFYEHQMTEYFKQFGVVTNARVIRSKRTGMSKGHAFVEFRDPNVAEIVAETMNNYLMGKRLIKAAVIPPEKQRRFAKRKHWNAQNNPGNDMRQKMKKAHNSVKDEKEELQIARKLISNLNKTKKRLLELDIDYDFFTPVDIPEPLLNLVEVKKEDEVKTDVMKKENKLKNKVKEEEKAQNNNKKNKAKKVNDKAQVSTTPTQADSSAPKKSKKSNEIQQSGDTSNLYKVTKEKNKNSKEKAEKNVAKETKDMKQSKKDETKSKASEMQKQKEKKLKDAGVKPPNFIQIQNESDDESDSSVNFDSDEYDEVMKQGDSDEQSDDESDEELDEDITSEEDASDEDESPPPKKVEKPSKAKAAATKNQQQGKKLRPKANKPPLQLIIKMSENTKPSKKPKFEKKGNKKTINKVIKKKK